MFIRQRYTPVLGYADERNQAQGQNRRGTRTSIPVAMVLLLVLSLILAACEYPGIPHPLAAQSEDSTPAAPSPTLSPSRTAIPTTTATPTPTPTPEPLQDTVQISLKDFHLEPNEVTVKAGTVTFVLKNEGRYTHDFRVEGQGVDEKAPKVGRGRTFEWQIALLEPGTYRISCPISNHADRGMVGTLEVVR